MIEKLAGVNSIMEAIKGRRKVHKIFIQDGRQNKRIEELLELASKKGIFIQKVDKERLNQMYRVGNHQGIVAQVDSYDYATIEEVLEEVVLKGQEPLLVILDGLGPSESRFHY